MIGTRIKHSHIEALQYAAERQAGKNANRDTPPPSELRLFQRARVGGLEA